MPIIPPSVPEVESLDDDPPIPEDPLPIPDMELPIPDDELPIPDDEPPMPELPPMPLELPMLEPPPMPLEPPFCEFDTFLATMSFFGFWLPELLPIEELLLLLPLIMEPD